MGSINLPLLSPAFFNIINSLLFNNLLYVFITDIIRLNIIINGNKFGTAKIIRLTNNKKFALYSVKYDI